MHLNLPLSYVKITNSKYSKLERLILLKERGGKKDEGKKNSMVKQSLLTLRCFTLIQTFKLKNLTLRLTKVC